MYAAGDAVRSGNTALCSLLPHLLPGFAGNCTMAAGRYDGGCAEEQLRAAGVDVAAGVPACTARCAPAKPCSGCVTPAAADVSIGGGTVSLLASMQESGRFQPQPPNSPTAVNGCMGTSDGDQPHEVMEVRWQVG